MKFKEILARWTGFSVPVFGVSWNPPEPESVIAQRVLAFLQDRRVLYNPYHLEVEDQCIHSVLESRRALTDEIGGLPADSRLGAHLRAIRATCRRFLNENSPGERGYLRRGPTGPFESTFFTSLGELRSSIGLHVGAIALMHGIDVEGELARVLPEADEPGWGK